MNLGERATTASRAPIRFGVLAPTSMVARAAVVPAIDASSGATVVATASRAAGETYESVLERNDVDAVYVPLPNGMHREWVERSAAAGKHVLCEKPLALTASDARAMVSACERAGVVLMEAYMTPFHPRSAALVDLASAGRFGTLVSARSVFTFPHTVPSDHRWDPALGGGALADVGIYALSPLLELATAESSAEPPSFEVTTHSVQTDRGVDATTVGLLHFPDRGFSATFECSFDAPERQLLEVVGTEARTSVEHCFTPDESDTDLVLCGRDGRIETVHGRGRTRTGRWSTTSAP
ncbi:MAG: Gfo/Idh/MocA family protein [Acidimicrobiales bacterium]